MLTGKSNCFISYNKLGPFSKLAPRDINALQTITSEVVEAARESLVIGTA
jgi:hypothetical protein